MRQHATEKNMIPQEIESVMESLLKSGCEYSREWNCSISLYANEGYANNIDNFTVRQSQTRLEFDKN